MYSVIIPTFNRADVLRRAVNSCLRQVNVSLEIIVVDDGSTDETQEYIASLLDSRIVYVKQENQGASSARNMGLSLARGKYICYLDSDDWYVEGRFSILNSYQDVMDSGYVLSSRVLVSGRNNSWIRPEKLFSEGVEFSEYIYCEDGYFSTPSLTFSRALAGHILWDTNLSYGDDTDYVFKLKSHGLNFLMLDQPLAIVDDVSIDGRLSLKKDLFSLESWFNKNRDKLTQNSQLAFKAKHLSFHGFWRRPLYFSWCLALAAKIGIFTPVKAFKYWLRAIMPIPFYKFLLNLYAR